MQHNQRCDRCQSNFEAGIEGEPVFKDCLRSRSIIRKKLFDDITGINWNDLKSIRPKRYSEFLQYIKCIVDTGDDFNTSIEENEAIERCAWAYSDMNAKLRLQWKDTARAIGCGYLYEK